MKLRNTILSSILLPFIIVSSPDMLAEDSINKKNTHKLAHERQVFHKFYKKLKALEQRLDPSEPKDAKTTSDVHPIDTETHSDSSSTQTSDATTSSSKCLCHCPCEEETRDLVGLCQPGMSFLRDSSSLKNSVKAIFSKDLFCNYAEVKNTVQKELNIQYSLDMTILPQQINHRHQNIAKPLKDKASIQTCYSPYINWDLFNCPGIGSGSFQFSYLLVRYWNNSASNLDSILGLQSYINDFPSRQDQFSQFSYTHALPGNLFTLVVGQYTLYSIDGGTYDNDQLSGFINYSLCQNGSATYSLGSLGSYLQIDPTDTLSFQVGFQDAYNVLGNKMTLRYWGKGKFNFFGYGSWSPNCKFGNGQYSFLLYNTRKVPEQLSSSTGWSLSLSQNFGKKLNIFGRANGVSGDALPIQRSFVLGWALANPLNRNSQDLIGMAASINRINRQASGIVGKMRKEEGIIEGLMTVGIGKYVSFSPDLQFIIHPSGRTDLSTALAYGIRFNASI